MGDLDSVFAALERSPFRRRFRLRAAEQAYLADKTLPVVLDHARKFVLGRLAPAAPDGDGRQTPMRGHPVFIAQHATATCCRKCLAKWHGIPQGKPLSEDQVDYVLRVLGHWLKRQAVPSKDAPQKTFDW